MRLQIPDVLQHEHRRPFHFNDADNVEEERSLRQALEPVRATDSPDVLRAGLNRIPVCRKSRCRSASPSLAFAGTRAVTTPFARDSTSAFSCGLPRTRVRRTHQRGTTFPNVNPPASASGDPSAPASALTYAAQRIACPGFQSRRSGRHRFASRLRERLSREVPEAQVLVFGAPPISGLGKSAGFKLMMEGIGDVDFHELQARADDLAAKGNQQPGLAGLFNSFRASTPQLYVDIDREQVKSMGVPLTDVFDALQACVGSCYVNDFNRFGRTWQVNVQADARFRVDAETVKQLKVRNGDGDMVPLGALAEVRDSTGPVQVTRYNMFPAAAVTGTPLPGTSMGDALATMERLSRDLPRNMATEWTEVSYLQKEAGKLEQFRDLLKNPFSAFALGVMLVYFVLAGLYEAWSLPWAVILVVPMCLLSALTDLFLAGMDVNIFVQVGFVALVGLAAKNAILIVEFARDRQVQGASRFDASVEAARVRLRPILMTSFAFILGVFPLVVARGAGAEMRQTLGMAVFAGMIGVTLFGIFLTPVFYYVIRGLVRTPQQSSHPLHLQMAVQ